MASEGGIPASEDASMKGGGSQTPKDCEAMQQSEEGDFLSPRHKTDSELDPTKSQHAGASRHSETTSQSWEERYRNEMREMEFDGVIHEIDCRCSPPGPNDQKESNIMLDVLGEKYSNLEASYLKAKENQRDRGSEDSGYSGSYSPTPTPEDNIDSFRQRRKSRKSTKNTGPIEIPDGIPTSLGRKRKAIDEHRGRKKSQKRNKDSSPSSSIDNAVTTDVVLFEPRDGVTSSLEDTNGKPTGKKRREQFRTIVDKVKFISAGLPIAPEVKKQLLGLLHTMTVMYEKQTRTGGYKRSETSSPQPRNAEEVLPLLHPEEASADDSTRCEEDNRPWLGGPWSQIPQETTPVSFPGLLMRITDYISECKIVDPSQGIVSTASDTILYTRPQRRQAIERHVNWADRNKTPFISASRSLADIRETYYPVFQSRHVRHGTREEYANCVIIGIKCYARRENKMPTLQARMEMKYYGAVGPIKYGAKYAYRDPVVRHEWLLPYLVSPNEIFAVYRVLDMEKWCQDNNGNDEDFFSRVMVRDFLIHEKARVEGRVYQHANCIRCGIAGPHKGCGSSREVVEAVDDDDDDDGEETL